MKSPPAQLKLWPLLKGIPSNFILYGGTAIALQQGLGCSIAVYGKQFDPATSLRALCSYRDGDLNELDEKIKSRLSAAARAVEKNKESRSNKLIPIPAIPALRELLPVLYPKFWQSQNSGMRERSLRSSLPCDPSSG